MDLSAELKAMQAIAEAIEPLTEDQRTHVLGWASSRFDVVLPTQRAANGSPPAGGQAGSKTEDVTFTEFVDLFDRANPKTDAEKAAVAGYWFQVIGGSSGWQSQPLNTALKDLGHGLGNITDSLDSLQERKPAWVRQVSKAGGQRQGRKTYKMTQAGINAVRAMLGRAPEAGEDGTE
jgi:hypothetical protein